LVAVFPHRVKIHRLWLPRQLMWRDSAAQLSVTQHWNGTTTCHVERDVLTILPG